MHCRPHSCSITVQQHPCNVVMAGWVGQQSASQERRLLLVLQQRCWQLADMSRWWLEDVAQQMASLV
jgi:hypothetical protein